MLWGYFKKLIIADRAGVLVNTVFDNYDSYSGSIIALAVFFYCIQLYCDFSGGIDTARGVAHLFGVNLAENFRRPIFADSVADYWRRWHITLGSWMRDYVFYPISLSKPFMKLGKFSRKHFSGVFGKILPNVAGDFYRLSDHRYLARLRSEIYRLRFLERYYHHSVSPAGTDL